MHSILGLVFHNEIVSLEALTQPIAKVNCSKKREFGKGAWGGAHRVHFEHSLLHDSVTTIKVAPD